MKRKLLLALIALTCALCLIFALAGCNPAENQSGTQQGGNSDDEKPDTHNYIFKCSQTEHWQSCTDCGEETAHTPHSVSDGVCPACGYVEKCTEGLKFWEIQENEEIIGYSVSKGTATDSHIFIPSFYNNLPVISIGIFAFYECESFESVTIGNGITSIGNGAFEGCTSLEEITIPDGVTYIGNGAFYYTAYCFNADNFKNDVLYIGNYLIGAKDTLSGSYQITPGTKLIADEAFWHCENLTKITIPDSVTSIGDAAFEGCKSLEGVYINDIVAWCNIDFGKYMKIYDSNPLYYAHNLYLKGQLVTNLEIPNGVTAIKRGAFAGCESLKEITIPKSVTSIIGWRAFYECTSLTKITIPDSVTSIDGDAFAGCTSLTEITIGNGVTSIGSDAFYKCTSLTEITIPDNVTSIGSDAFYDCTNIKTATMPTLAIKYIPKDNLQTVILTSGDSIGSGAFLGCRSLTEITIPDSVTSIGRSAFSGCTSLENITVDKENKVYRSEDNCLIETETQTVIVGCKTSKIPESVTSIGSFAFQGCTSLEEITIPDSVTSIGDYAFAYCESLKETTIPDSVTSIGDGAFSGCTSLENITVDKENKVYRSEDNCLIETKTQTVIVGCKTSKIPESVTSIGSFAFQGCTSLEEITIPDSVTSIGSGAFSGCTNIKAATMPTLAIGYIPKDNLQTVILTSGNSIGSFEFQGCTSLEEITIPDSVTSIGYEAFRGCESLKRLIFENTQGWKVSRNFDMSNFEDINVKDPEQNAENLKDKYNGYYWKRGE